MYSFILKVLIGLCSIYYLYSNLKRLKLSFTGTRRYCILLSRKWAVFYVSTNTV